VGSSQNGYVTECFFDELCRAGGQDPFEARRKLLTKKPRHKAVLEAAAKLAKWGSPVPEGRARGIAVHESYGSFVAQVAEVSLDERSTPERPVPKVHKVYCAVDCGQVINPDTIEAQMESSIAYAMSMLLHGQITLDKGRAEQSNFHDYPAARLSEMPRVEVALVPSGDAHGGVGEPGFGPLAPAVCNALLALTGTPTRQLPILRS